MLGCLPRGATVLLLAAAFAIAQDTGGNLGASGSDDDDVAQMLKDFDNGYDTSTKGLFANTVDQMKQPASTWSAVDQVETADQAFAGIESGSDLGAIEDSLAGSERLGSSQDKIPHKRAKSKEGTTPHKPATSRDESVSVEGPTDVVDGPGVMLGESDDVSTPDGGHKSHRQQGHKHTTIPPPEHDGWASLTQFNHYELNDALKPDDVKRLTTWMTEHGMPTNPDVGEGADVAFRNEDIQYGHQMGHWKKSYLVDKQQRVKQDETNRKKEEKETAFVSIADYLEEHKVKLSPNKKEKLQQWIINTGAPEGPGGDESDLGEGASPDSSDGSDAKTFRSGDIDFALEAKEWDGDNTKFETIGHYIKRTHTKLIADEQQKLAAWMRLQKMECKGGHDDLGEDAAVAVKEHQSIAKLQEEFLQKAATAEWRVADIEYSLQAGQWKTVVI